MLRQNELASTVRSIRGGVDVLSRSTSHNRRRYLVGFVVSTRAMHLFSFEHDLHKILPETESIDRAFTKIFSSSLQRIEKREKEKNGRKFVSRSRDKTQNEHSIWPNNMEDNLIMNTIMAQNGIR